MLEQELALEPEEALHAYWLGANESMFRAEAKRNPAYRKARREMGIRQDTDSIKRMMDIVPEVVSTRHVTGLDVEPFMAQFVLNYAKGYMGWLNGDEKAKLAVRDDQEW